MTHNENFSIWRTIGLLAGLITAVLLTVMDQTAISTAMPTIVSQLGGLNLYAWVFTAYMLSQTAFLTILGKLSDLYGRRLMFLLGVGAFMIGSILCAQAKTMQQLIFFRGLQGIGGAGLMPTALSIIGVHYGPQQRGRLVGFLGGAAALAVIIGPIVGSLIVEKLSWRWIFYVNLPLGLLSAILVTVFLREPREKKASLNIDYLGALTLIGWVSSLNLAFFYTREYSWSSFWVLGLLAAAAALFTIFLFNESRTREPILPLWIFRNPTIATAGAVTIIRAVGFYSLSIYVPLLVQGVLGGTSEGARNALIMFSLPSIAGSILAGVLLGRNLSYRLFMATGLAIFGLGLWLVSRTVIATSQTVLNSNMIIAGFGAGIVYSTTLLAFQNSVTREHMGTASSLTQFLNNLAGTVSIGLLGTYQSSLLVNSLKPILASPALKKLPQEAAQMLDNPETLGQVLTNSSIATQLPAQLLSELRETLQISLRSIFLVGLIFVAVAFIVSLFMRGSAANQPPKISNDRHQSEPEKLWLKLVKKNRKNLK